MEARQTFSNESIDLIGDSIESKSSDAPVLCLTWTRAETLNEDHGLKPRTTGHAVKMAKLYAVRAEFNGLLDIARSTYKENVADIHESKFFSCSLVGFMSVQTQSRSITRSSRQVFR